jgi:heptosyltransferase III
MRDDIFEVLKREERGAERRYHQGLIIQPGALGDCILTLPLARFMLNKLQLQSIDIIGHSEYISIFPGRTCISKIRSLEAIPFHRLFTDSIAFDLEESDPLVTAFAPYEWIATFLGGDDTDFEKNLIFTANCSSGTEVTSIEVKAPDGLACHIAEYYIRKFVEKNSQHVEPEELDSTLQLIRPTRFDISGGKQLLEDAGLIDGPPVIIQPGSSGARKNWAIDNFISVAAQLRQQGLAPAFLLGPAEMQNFAPEVLENMAAVAPCISGLILADVVALLSSSFAFVGNDSGITHLSAAMGVQTIAIFTSTSSPCYRPLGPNVAIMNLGSESLPSDASMADEVAAHIINLHRG